MHISCPVFSLINLHLVPKLSHLYLVHGFSGSFPHDSHPTFSGLNIPKNPPLPIGRVHALHSNLISTFSVFPQPIAIIKPTTTAIPIAANTKTPVAPRLAPANVKLLPVNVALPINAPPVPKAPVAASPTPAAIPAAPPTNPAPIV